MSASGRLTLRVALLLIVAAILQLAFGSSWSVRGAQPNLILIVAALCALHFGATGAAGVGFGAGLLTACVASPPHAGFGSLIVSATLACWVVGRMEGHLFRDNPVVAVALAIGQVAGAEALFYIFAPQPGFGAWLRNSGLTVLFDALLAAPLWLAIRRVLRSADPAESF
jgi:rod shape-determining protein MreD